MKKIHSDTMNLRSLLSRNKFTIDYYQREYRWETKQVSQLIDDLAGKFRDSHEQGNDRSNVEQYGHYFLGPIIVSDKNGRNFVIDGQQRLTTLTLLLIHIYRQLDNDKQKGVLADLIISHKYDKSSFNIDVEERNDCMHALFEGTAFDETDQPESVANIFHRYKDLEGLFPDDLAGTDTLPYFADWLIENVYIVRIIAYSDVDAYTIFETMNDRGLSLTSTEMLKGHLLVNITDPEHRNRASDLWRKQVINLQNLGKGEEDDAIRAWLRSQYAQNIRQGKRNAEPGDFDRIGTEFHRWVRESEKKLNLSLSNDFVRFIKEDFAFYSRYYIYLYQASQTPEKGLDAINFCAHNNFTLQYPVLLAPLRREDNEQEIHRKLRVVSAYLDIFITQRIWNRRAIDYSTMRTNMFRLMCKIRGKELTDLVDILGNRLADETENFATNPQFGLRGNRWKIHLLLARMIDYLETCSGRPSRYHEYIQGGKKGYEIEHIWANHPDRYTDEFEHSWDFAEYRNRIGGLLLLPKSFNASYGDKDYTHKREHYIKQNLLAQSLHENAYKQDPGFTRFIRESGLPFQPHAQYKKADLDTRQNLYIYLAERIWSPERLIQAAES